MLQNERIDPRALRSKEFMQEALVSLINEKEYAKITISEITDRARLSRPTFYLHYRTKEDIIIDCFNKNSRPIILEFMSLVQNNQYSQQAIPAMTKLIELIEQQKELYKVIIAANKQQIIVDFSEQFLLDFFQERVAKDKDKKVHSPVKLNVLAKSLAGAWTNLILGWVQGDLPLSPKELAVTFARVFLPILPAVIDDGVLDDIF